MTPVSEWKYGDRYGRVWACYHHDRNGVMDPTIIERIVLLDEIPEYLAFLRRNPNCTAFVVKEKMWRGQMRKTDADE